MTMMAASEPEIRADSTAQKLSRIKAIVAASSGNLVEWYDFYAYAFTSIYFAAAFFPSGDQTSQLLATAGIFAVGFFMRPLGGWLFGWIADAHGRKNSMVLSVLLMCAGSLMIGILPTYQTIGAAAPALLLFARMAQGLSVGGEYGTAATYMSEIAGKGNRGFYSSFQYVTLDRRTASRAPRCGDSAADIVARRVEGMGMAGSVPVWRRRSHCGLVSPPLIAGDGVGGDHA